MVVSVSLVAGSPPVVVVPLEVETPLLAPVLWIDAFGVTCGDCELRDGKSPRLRETWSGSTAGSWSASVSRVGRW
jgi:hypothetical protein